MTNEHETPEQQIERLFSEIAACRLCRGTLTVRVKHGTIYITDSDDEIERAYHNERCSNCAERLAAALKREREHAQAEIERLTKERDEQARLFGDMVEARASDQCRISDLVVTLRSLEALIGTLDHAKAVDENHLSGYLQARVEQIVQRIRELEQVNKELLEVLEDFFAAWISGAFESYSKNAASRRTIFINIARAALAKHNKGAKG